MTNPYYTFDTPLTPGTRGRAGELNDQFLAIQTGFDNIPAVGSAPFGTPTVKVGLAPFDQGVSNFVLRADAKFVLDETIAPTWTGQHSNTTPLSGLTGPARFMSSTPGYLFQETDVAVNSRWWRHYASGGVLVWDISNDAASVATSWMAVTRTGTTVDSIALASTALTWNGTQLATLGNNTFTGNMIVSNTAPEYGLSESDASANNKRWQMYANGEALRLAVVTDGGTPADFMVVDRTGQTVDSIALTSTALTWNGSQLVTSANVFSSILALDGSGSGLDADLLDGVQGADYARISLGNTFTADQQLNSNHPSLVLRDTGAGTNLKAFGWQSTSGVFQLVTYNDAGAGLSGPVQFTRAADGTLSDISLVSVALRWNGTQVATLGANTFTGDVTVSSTAPTITINETDAAANNRRWDVRAQAEQLEFRVVNDAVSTSAVWLAVNRTANTIDSVALVSTALTWNGTQLATRAGNSFSGDQEISSAEPVFRWSETDAAVDNRNWEIVPVGEQLRFRAINDALSSAVTWLAIDRTGTTVDSIALTSTALTWNGNTLFTTANDGAGSGLDADLLDGQSSAFYQSASNLNAGTVPAARMPAHTGDVTSSTGAVALTIANDAVTYAKMQNVSATSRVLGRITAGAGDTEELTGANLSTIIGLATIATSGSASDLGSGTIPSARVTSVDAACTINSFVLGYVDVPRRTSGFAKGECLAVSAGQTLNTSDMATGRCFSLYNDSASTITLTQGSGVTLRKHGTTTTGNLTVAVRGMVTIWCNSGTEAIAMGDVS